MIHRDRTKPAATMAQTPGTKSNERECESFENWGIWWASRSGLTEKITVHNPTAQLCNQRTAKPRTIANVPDRKVQQIIVLSRMLKVISSAEGSKQRAKNAVFMDSVLTVSAVSSLIVPGCSTRTIES